MACRFVTVWGKVVPGDRGTMFRLPVSGLCGPVGRGTGMSPRGCRYHCGCVWTPRPLVWAALGSGPGRRTGRPPPLAMGDTGVAGRVVQLC